MDVFRVAFYPGTSPASYREGGGALAIWKTAVALAAHPQVELSLVVPRRDAREGIDGFERPVETFETEAELGELLRRFDPDVVHGFRPSFRPLLDRARGLGIPTVFEVRAPNTVPCRLVHALRPPLHKGWRAAIQGAKVRRLARDASAVLVPSRAARRQLVRDYRIDPARVHHAYNGIDYETFGERDWSSVPAPKPRLINAGRMSTGKRFDLVIRTYARLRREFPSISLDLVGDGEERAGLERFCRVEGIEGVTFHGVVDQRRLAALYRGAHLLLNGSRAESFGNVVAEAMACGLPVVAFEVGSLPELVEEGSSGFLCAPGDEEAHFRHAAELLANPERLAVAGRAAAARVRSWFTWERRAEDIVRLYRRLGPSTAA